MYTRQQSSIAVRSVANALRSKALCVYALQRVGQQIELRLVALVASVLACVRHGTDVVQSYRDAL